MAFSPPASAAELSQRISIERPIPGKVGEAGSRTEVLRVCAARAKFMSAVGVAAQAAINPDAPVVEFVIRTGRRDEEGRFQLVVDFAKRVRWGGRVYRVLGAEFSLDRRWVRLVCGNDKA